VSNSRGKWGWWQEQVNMTNEDNALCARRLATGVQSAPCIGALNYKRRGAPSRVQDSFVNWLVRWSVYDRLMVSFWLGYGTIDGLWSGYDSLIGIWTEYERANERNRISSLQEEFQAILRAGKYLVIFLSFIIFTVIALYNILSAPVIYDLTISFFWFFSSKQGSCFADC
jgi:hypothetical protein